MGQQIFDSNGNLVTPIDPTASPDQQVANISGNIINPSEEDGNLLSVKTNTDNLDTLLSTRASEATTLDIKTQTDQLTFSSSRLVVDASQVVVPISDNGGSLTVDGTVTANQGGTWNVNALGTTAAGASLTENPLAISGVDGSGVKRTVRTDSNGFIVPVNMGVVVSSNSTSTPLGAGASFTGPFVEIKDYSTVSIMIYADQPSASLGFEIEWSSDGTNVDDTDRFNFSPSNFANRQYTFGPIARYFRLRYTNGATPQTTFRLQTMLRPFDIKPSSHRVGNTISVEADAELVKAVVTAQDAVSSVFSNISGHSVFGAFHLGTMSADIRLGLALQQKLYTANPQQNLPTNAAENNAFLIRNPAGSGKNLYLSDFIFDVITKDRQCVWQLYRSPTITGTGTSTPITATYIDSAPASSMLVYSNPTTSSLGTRIRTFSTGVNSNSTQVNFGIGFILAPGQDILITGIPNGNNVLVAMTAVWGEV